MQPSLTEQLDSLDEQIHRLVTQRKALADHIKQIKEASKRGKMFHAMLYKSHQLRNSCKVREYINTKLLHWKNHLPPLYFPLTLDALPESISPHCNAFEVQIFFMEAFDAFQRDWDRLHAGRE